MTEVVEPKKITLTDAMRLRFKGVLDPIAAFLNRLGLMPNTITLLGLLGNMVAVYFLWRGNMTIGGLIILAVGPIDALDGAMARLRGMPTQFGAFVDSVTDRYSDLLMLGGLLMFYAGQANQLAVGLAYAAAVGTVLVSYTRARAQSLGIETKIGMLSRLERYIVLVPALILNFPIVALWIMAIFTNITALQRIWDVRRQFHNGTR
ncbi:MAG: CDP-alcohol phosphatidyltransferase family protein [Anaerolineales bacterium]